MARQVVLSGRITPRGRVFLQTHGEVVRESNVDRAFQTLGCYATIGDLPTYDSEDPWDEDWARHLLKKESAWKKS